MSAWEDKFAETLANKYGKDVETIKKFQRSEKWNELRDYLKGVPTTDPQPVVTRKQRRLY